MGETDRYSEYRQPARRFTLGQEGNALVALFTINVIFFLLLLSIKVIYNNQDSPLFNTKIVPYFNLPAQLSTLAERPWTIITAMFTHINVWDMISNMLWLWMFGYILQEMTGNQKLIPIYIYGGLFGIIFFVASAYIYPSFRPLIKSAYFGGAVPSVLAVTTATTFLAPDYRILRNINRGIPIWIIAVIYFVICFLKSASNPLFALANLGGAISGFLFVFLLRKGKDTSIWMNNFYSWFMDLFNPNKKIKSTSSKEKIFYNTGGRAPYKKNSIVTQQRIDEILDKINQKGYHFLTDEEKNILRKASEEDL